MDDIIDVKNQRLFKQHARMLIERESQDYWFLGKDVCKILKYNTYFPYNNFFTILKTLPTEAIKMSNKNIYINKNALFFFIIKSGSKHGKHFRSLLIQKILPSFFFDKTISHEFKKNIITSSPVNLSYDYNSENKVEENKIDESGMNFPVYENINIQPVYENVKSPQRYKNVNSPQRYENVNKSPKSTKNPKKPSGKKSVKFNEEHIYETIKSPKSSKRYNMYV